MCCVIGYTGHDMSADKFKEYLMRTVSRGPDDQRVVEGQSACWAFMPWSPCPAPCWSRSWWGGIWGLTPW